MPSTEHALCELHTNGKFFHWIPWRFYILRMSLHPIGNITAPAAAISRNVIFFLYDCCHSLELLYFSLQRKHWFFYIVFSLELKLILKLFVIYLCRIREILGFQVQCYIVVLIFQNLNVSFKCYTTQTTISIGCEKLRQEISRILPTCTKICSNRAHLFIKISDVVSKLCYEICNLGLKLYEN